MHFKDERGSVMDGRLRVMMVVVGMLLMHSPVWAAPLPKPKHTKNTKFLIPFKFDSSSLQRMNAREIQLHVSRDQGATWELAQSLPPEGGKFEFQAATEGEYWFAVKTLDGRNQIHPPRGSYETGLIVVVDNTAPTLDLALQQGGDGKVQLTWKAADANLDSTTLRFEFLAPDSQNWEAIPIVPHNRGETTFTVDQAGAVAVRGSVSDFAENIGQAREQINATAIGGRGRQQKHRGPVAEHPVENSVTSFANESIPVPTPFTAVDSEPEYSGPVITPMGKLPPYSQASGNSKPIRERWQNASTGAEVAPFSNAVMESTRESQSPRNTAATQPQSPEPMPPQRPAQPRRQVSRQRVVNTRRFQLGYAVAEVGASGVSAVELFITEDNGRKWWKYGDDPDQKSPFDVEVPHDGTYGFTIRARSGAGLSIGPPLPNEPPETVVAVDQTAPIVELVPIEQGRGSNVNKLRIRWKITEDNPSEMPVSLEFAPNLNGPWTQISGWREDVNHSFDWMVGPSVPTQFYLRVLARDAAGNIGKAETQLPIIVDLVQPTARIVDVEVTPSPPPQ